MPSDAGKPIPMKPLREILTRQGMTAVRRFVCDYNDRLLIDKDELGLILALRDRLKPVEVHLVQPTDFDLEYLALAICHSLGIVSNQTMDGLHERAQEDTDKG